LTTPACHMYWLCIYAGHEALHQNRIKTQHSIGRMTMTPRTVMMKMKMILGMMTMTTEQLASCPVETKSVLGKFHQPPNASARSVQTQHLGQSETFPRGQWSSMIRNLGKPNGQTASASGLGLRTEEFGLGFCISRWFSQAPKLNPHPPHPLI